MIPEINYKKNPEKTHKHAEGKQHATQQLVGQPRNQRKKKSRNTWDK